MPSRKFGVPHCTFQNSYHTNDPPRTYFIPPKQPGMPMVGTCAGINNFLREVLKEGETPWHELVPPFRIFAEILSVYP